MHTWSPADSLEDKVKLVHMVLRSYRLNMNDEKQTQIDIEKAFIEAGIPHKRECALGKSGIIDFLVDDMIGVEVKIKGAKMSIFRQCRRYCGSGQIKHIMLATLVPMSLPETIEDIPTSVCFFGTAFLM